MCSSQLWAAAAGPRRPRSAAVTADVRGERTAGRRVIVRGITLCAGRGDDLLHSSHQGRTSGDVVGTWCDSGVVTTLHPVRSAPPPGTDPAPAPGALPGADLLAAVLA